MHIKEPSAASSPCIRGAICCVCHIADLPPCSPHHTLWILAWPPVKTRSPVVTKHASAIKFIVMIQIIKMYIYTYLAGPCDSGGDERIGAAGGHQVSSPSPHCQRCPPLPRAATPPRARRSPLHSACGAWTHQTKILKRPPYFPYSAGRMRGLLHGERLPGWSWL